MNELMSFCWHKVIGSLMLRDFHTISKLIVLQTQIEKKRSVAFSVWNGNILLIKRPHHTYEIKHLSGIRRTLQPSNIYYCQMVQLLYMPTTTKPNHLRLYHPLKKTKFCEFCEYVKGLAGCRCSGQPYPQTSTNLDFYPKPKVEDLYMKLSQGRKFTKLDLRSAFLQVLLHKDSKKFHTINTPRGLYQFNCLSFRVKFAPGIYQRCMDNLFVREPRVVSYQDDILITGSYDTEHLGNLERILKTLSASGLWIRLD